MKAVPIHEAKTNLSKYIAQAKRGEPVYIGSFGRAEVVLTVVPKRAAPLLWGSMQGKLSVSDEEWNQAEALANSDFETALSEDE